MSHLPAEIITDGSFYQPVAKVLLVRNWLLRAVVEKLENSQETPVFLGFRFPWLWWVGKLSFTAHALVWRWLSPRASCIENVRFSWSCCSVIVSGTGCPTLWPAACTLDRNMGTRVVTRIEWALQIKSRLSWWLDRSSGLSHAVSMESTWNWNHCFCWLHKWFIAWVVVH